MSSILARSAEGTGITSIGPLAILFLIVISLIYSGFIYVLIRFWLAANRVIRSCDGIVNIYGRRNGRDCCENRHSDCEPFQPSRHSSDIFCKFCHLPLKIKVFFRGFSRLYRECFLSLRRSQRKLRQLRKQKSASEKHLVCCRICGSSNVENLKLSECLVNMMLRAITIGRRRRAHISSANVF